MVVTVKNVSDLFSKDVFTNRGVFAGRISEVTTFLSVDAGVALFRFVKRFAPFDKFILFNCYIFHS